MINAIVSIGPYTASTVLSVPILSAEVELWLYPNIVVAGVDNEVYFESFIPETIDPANFVGTIEDSNGSAIVRMETTHFGRGRFVFTPIIGETYILALPNGSR
jgi:hypothetical protein